MRAADAAAAGKDETDATTDATNAASDVDDAGCCCWR